MNGKNIKVIFHTTHRNLLGLTNFMNIYNDMENMILVNIRSENGYNAKNLTVSKDEI